MKAILIKVFFLIQKKCFFIGRTNAPFSHFILLIVNIGLGYVRVRPPVMLSEEFGDSFSLVIKALFLWKGHD